MERSQKLRRYIRREYSKNLKITSDGVAIHDPCISHCLRHAFGACDLEHLEACSNCESLFTFFEQLRNSLGSGFYQTLDEYQKKLIAWMGHLARKSYLNTHVQASLDELDNDGTVII